MTSLSAELLSSAPDKVILVGDVGVGKTSMFSRFATGLFEAQIRDAEIQKSWVINDKTVTVSRYGGCHRIEFCSLPLDDLI